MENMEKLILLIDENFIFNVSSELETPVMNWTVLCDFGLNKIKTISINNSIIIEIKTPIRRARALIAIAYKSDIIFVIEQFSFKCILLAHSNSIPFIITEGRSPSILDMV